MAIRTIANGSETLGTVTAGDDVVLLGGSATIDTNVDNSALTGIANVEVGPTFNGSLGTVDSPFIAQITTLFFYGASGGDCYFNSTDDLGAASTARVLMPPGAGGHFHFMTAGTITKAEIGGGKFTAATAVAVTNLYLSGSSVVRMYDATSTDPTLVQNEGGTLYLDRGATTITHNSGQTWIQGKNASAITTLNVYGPGVQIVDSGTITTVNCWGGIPDSSRLTRALTISNTNINMALPRDQIDAFLYNPRITHSSTTKFLGR